jgi:hypothetical protein
MRTQRISLVLVSFFVLHIWGCAPGDADERTDVGDRRTREAALEPAEGVHPVLKAVLDELQQLPPDELLEFANTPEENLIGRYHLGFGMWIRDHWDLWRESEVAEYFISRGMDKADDMSSIILISLHRRLNGRPLDVDAQIEELLSAPEIPLLEMVEP